MNSNSLISVIIPIYNTKDYLPRCLDSVINQTYTNLQIICVNDYSFDGSVEVVREYMEKDARIRLVNNSKNMGLYHARLEGMKVADGDYIAFLDSDDYISLDYYRCLLEESQKSDAEIVFSKIIHENSDGERYVHNLYHFYDFDTADKTPFEAFFEQQGQCFAWHTVWNKLYKRRVWDLALPYLYKQSEHLIMAEDFVFSTCLFFFARKISYVNYSYHFYYQHKEASTSLSGGYNKYLKNINDLGIAFNFVGVFLREMRVSDGILTNFEKWKDLYGRFWYDNIINGDLNSTRKNYLLNLLKKRLGVKELKKTKRQDHYFYSITTTWDSRYYELQNYLINGDIEYYSFDIFDTLILRPFLYPTDLFYCLEKDYHNFFGANNSFVEIRKSAERLLRQKKGKEECTLDEIYKFINERYLLDADKLEILKKKEIELEIEKAYGRESTINLYNMLSFMDKKIIIISDIYLDLATIEKILHKNSVVNYYRVFLSSEYGKTKQSGELYNAVVEELNVEPCSIFHIGDAWNSDVENARKVGLQEHFYAKTSEVFKNAISDINNTEVFNNYFKPSNSWVNFEKSLRFFEVRCALAICANKLCDNPYESYKQGTSFNCNSQFIGYFPVGMHLLGVSQWIHKNMSDYEMLHFIGRDGYLFKKAYEVLYGDENTNYLELSRKALLPLSIINGRDILSLGKYMVWDKSTPKKILTLLSNVLEIGDKKICLDIEKPFETEEAFNEFLLYVIKNFYSESKKRLFDQTMAQHFKEKIGPKDILFDIGYSGRSQIILSRLLGYPIDGFYIHINDDENLTIQKDLGIKIQSFYNFTPSLTGGAREYLFSKQVGSLIGFDISDGDVRYEHEKYDINYADLYCIREIQNKAIGFVSDFYSHFSNQMDIMLCRNMDVSLPFEQLIHNSYNDLDVFNACIFEDELYAGKKEIVLSEIWRRDIGYHFSNTIEVIKVYNDGSDTFTNDEILNCIQKSKKWKKALCYFVLNKKLFWTKIKGVLGKGRCEKRQ